MPVFDFSNPESTTTTTEVTYTTFHSDKNVATPEDPILLLDQLIQNNLSSTGYSS